MTRNPTLEQAMDDHSDAWVFHYERIPVLVAEVERLRDQLESARYDRDVLGDALELSERKHTRGIEGANEALDRLTKARDSLSEQLQTALDDLASARGDAAQARLQRADYAQLSAALSRVSRLEADFARVKQSRDELADDLDRVTGELETERAACASAVSRFQEAVDERDEWRNKHTEMRSSRDEYEAKLATLRTAADGVRSELDSVREEANVASYTQLKAWSLTLQRALDSIAQADKPPSRSRMVETCGCGCDRVPCPKCGVDMVCEECQDASDLAAAHEARKEQGDEPCKPLEEVEAELAEAATTEIGKDPTVGHELFWDVVEFLVRLPASGDEYERDDHEAQGWELATRLRNSEHTPSQPAAASYPADLLEAVDALLGDHWPHFAAELPVSLVARIETLRAARGPKP